MVNQIFVNLPVSDLEASKTFFGKLGFSFNPQFSDDKAACMVMSETIYAMLLTQEYFKTFAPRPISNAKQATEVLLALSLSSRAEVEQLIHKAVAAGGSLYSEPKDHGFMYQHGFQDPDGHVWEVFYMDPSAVQG